MPVEGIPALLWLPGLALAGPEFALDGDDAHYVARVCRAQVGDILHATDGAGTRASLSVAAVRGEVRVRLGETRRESQPPRAIVASGAPEKDRADWLVEKIAELGVTEFQPLECERAGWERFAARRERLGRLAVAALRQSRRAWLLRIREPLDPAGWTDSLAGAGRRWLADPAGHSADWSAGSELEVVAIGPSAGFSPGERDLLATAEFQPVRLSSGRLRTETAAVAWASGWSAASSATDRTR
ncbi:MAG: RsmE family RNA methyltransferase [Candidatus Eisenbacteria bacterium]